MSDDHEPTAKVKRRRRNSQFFGWILVAVMIGGLGGFGVTNFGSGTLIVGSLGSQEMTANAYARALRDELNRFSQQLGTQMTLSQAAPFGVADRALQGLIQRTALDDEMGRIGLSVGDAAVATQIAAIASFQITPGVFDAGAYRDALARSNLTEAEFETGLRGDSARQVLTAAVVAGFEAPAPLTAAVQGWTAEKRGFSLLRLSQADLPAPLPAPDDAALAAFHTDNIADYTRGEARRITYAALLPDTLAPAMAVKDDAVRALYDARADEFLIPEKRLAERLIFPDTAAAEAALASLSAGKTFDDLVAGRDLTLADVDMGDVTRADLGAAADAVFAVTEAGAVSAVVQTDLGPALFRVNAVIEAMETTFDEVKSALTLELQLEAARKAISDRLEGLEDLLAGGASLQDLAKEDGVVLATTDYVPGADDNAEIAGYTAFRKAAESAAQGDFAEWIGLEDGGIVALQLDAVIPPAPLALDAVKDRVTEDWQAAALADALAALAEERKAAIEAGAAIGTFGIVTSATAAGREAQVPDAPQATLAEAFEMAVGEVRILTEGDQVAVLLLDSITPAETTGEAAETLRKAVGAALAQAFSADALQLFNQALIDQGGLQLDPAVVSAVQTSFN